MSSLSCERRTPWENLSTRHNTPTMWAKGPCAHWWPPPIDSITHLLTSFLFPLIFCVLQHLFFPEVKEVRRIGVELQSILLVISVDQSIKSQGRRMVSGLLWEVMLTLTLRILKPTHGMLTSLCIISWTSLFGKKWKHAQTNNSTILKTELTRYKSCMKIPLAHKYSTSIAYTFKELFDLF